MRTILLGAGASVEAKVPTAKKMVELIYWHFRHFDGRISDAMQTAIGGLKLHRSVECAEPFDEVDIEDVYETLRLLGSRESNLLSPFVGSWSHAIQRAERPELHQAVNGVAVEIAEMTRDALARFADQASKSSYLYLNHEPISRSLSHALLFACGRGESAFSSAADEVLTQIVDRTWIDDPSRVGYLEKLVTSSENEPLWIASLNFDNTIELAAKQATLTVDLGIRAGEPSIRFDEESRISLAKLHGSVTWSYDESGRITVAQEKVPSPAMIFGSGNKLRIEGPYLDLLFAFRERLERSEEVWVCGYSFRDQHINYLLLGWLQAADGRKLCVFDPCLSIADIERNLSAAMPRGWQLIAGNLKGRVDLEKLYAGDWVRRYFGEQSCRPQKVDS